MLFLIMSISACFLMILFYYQKKGLIYIGYTTVLTLMFGIVLLLSLLCYALEMESHRVIFFFLVVLIWILGSVVIYLMSQLTLAFEKIAKLSQHIAIKETEEKIN